jgi:hypothetical protein
MSNNTIFVNSKFEEVDTRTIDERNRLTIGELIKDYKRVRIYKNNRGEIFLQPIVEIPASELWLLQDKETLEGVLKGIKDASDGKISRLDFNEL